jgi:hypothetical protein
MLLSGPRCEEDGTVVMKLSSYMFEVLREDELTLCRGVGDGLDPVLLVAPAGEYSRHESLERLKHEYSLRTMLDRDWSARPVALVPFNGRMTLVLEHPGGEPLDRLLSRAMDVTQFLRIAIPLAVTLGKVHERGLTIRISNRPVRPLLGESEADLGWWRDALSEALGPNGQLIVNLVPELELVIGKQPAVPDLPPQDARYRFQTVFRRFLGVFARKEQPLALFLDDLQWLDMATLELIEHLATHPEVRHLLLVGAFRDNEVGTAHPLRRMLEAISKADARVHEIVLTPLGLEGVGRLVADLLHCEPARVRPLVQLVQEKTRGRNRHSDKAKSRSDLNRPESGEISERLLKTLRNSGDFQAEYEGSIPFTHSKQFQ